MRQAFSTQQRFDAPAIRDIPLNFECRDKIVPLLAALQHVYLQPELRSSILDLVHSDINQHTRTDVGREGFSYWQILVLSAVRLGCNLDYDKLQDLSENHNRLRTMLQVGPWDESTSFHWQRIRDNVCLLTPETIDAISHRIVAAGHALVPDAASTTRADSTVVETAIHYPTESTLIRDGVRKIIEMCVPLAEAEDLPGWRQIGHLFRKVKRISRDIERIAARKGKNYEQRLKTAYSCFMKTAPGLLHTTMSCPDSKQTKMSWWNKQRSCRPDLKIESSGPRLTGVSTRQRTSWHWRTL